jgi:hypothetical protein
LRKENKNKVSGYVKTRNKLKEQKTAMSRYFEEVIDYVT